MFGIQAKKKLAAVAAVLTHSQRGIHKRIDENRELLELLQERAPEFLATHFWVEGWLRSQDDFLSDLSSALPVPNPVPTGSFPRPWPTGGKSEAAAALDLAVSPVTYAAEVHQYMNANLFAAMLAAFETEAKVFGFQFTKGEVGRELPESVKHHLGVAAMSAKCKYVSPFMTEADIKDHVSRQALDGDARTWADGILAALNNAGIAISPIYSTEPTYEAVA